MEIKQDIGALQQDKENSVAQRTRLFAKVEEVQNDLTALNAGFNAHVTQFNNHVAAETAVFEQVADHETVLSPFRDAKTKAIGVLAVLALFGGGVGSQAERLLSLLVGK